MENETFLEEFKKYIANPKSRLVIFLGVAAFSVVSIALVFLVINNSNVSQEMAAAKKIEENPAQKAEILSQIVKNNPKSSVNSNINPGSQTKQTTPGTKDKFSGNSGYVTIDPATGLPVGSGSNSNAVAVGPNEQPDLTKYNYRKSTEDITPGTISDVCGYAFSYVSAGRYVSSEFFDYNNSYYVRNNEYPDGTLKGFYNSHYGPNVNETFSYAGGDYAVKQNYTSYWYNQQANSVLSYPVPTSDLLPTSGPVSFAVINNILNNYFGGNATVRRVYQQANRTFYEIQVTYKYNCADNTNPAIAPYIDSDGNINLVSVETVDAQTFEIGNSKTYIDHVAADTLVYTRDYKVEYKLTDFGSVSSEFQNISVSDVRTIDWSTYVFSKTEYANRISTYLRDSNQELILPVDDLNMNYLSAKNVPSALPNGDYFKDRKFYTAGANGDTTYSEVMKRFGPYVPTLSYNMATANDYSTYWFQQYGTDVDYELLLKNFRSYGPFGTTEFNRSINVGGESVEVIIRQYVYYDSYYNYYPTSYPASFVLDLANKYPTISALSYPASYPYFGYSNVSYSVLFQYHGKTYYGSVNGWAMDRFLSEPFENITPATEAGYNKISQILEGGVYGGGYSDYGYAY